MDRIDWDALYGQYTAHHFGAWCRRKYAGEFELPAAAVARIARPAPEDVAWITDALKHGTRPPAGRKWFVSQLLRRSDSMAESLLVPVLDAAIDEVDPSYNQH